MLTEKAVQSVLEAHLGRQAGRKISIEQLGRKSQGFSWITYAFTAHGLSEQPRRLILRVAPENGLFAPYSTLPQVFALQLMTPSPVPVPSVVSVAEDGDELGHPFFVCEHIDGHVPAPWSASSLDAAHRRSIAGQFISILGNLHKVEWQNTPFADLSAESGRPEVAAIAAWQAKLSRPTARYYPILEWGGDWLVRNCPVPARRTVVHGDYRIGNFIELDGKIVSILDWELAHPGDPHEDLAWALMPTFNGGSHKLYDVMDHDEVIDAYQAASGIAISRKSIAFYQAYALYQAAAIQMCAVYAFEVDRFLDMRMAVMGSQMASIVRAFDRALEAAA